MLKKYIIKKALTQNNVDENDIVVIKTDRTSTFSIHLFRLLMLLLLNFAMQTEMTASEIYNFIMQSFEAILDIATTELEIALHNFTILYDRKLTNIVELYSKDECLLVLIMQDKINMKLKNIKEMTNLIKNESK